MLWPFVICSVAWSLWPGQVLVGRVSREYFSIMYIYNYKKVSNPPHNGIKREAVWVCYEASWDTFVLYRLDGKSIMYKVSNPPHNGIKRVAVWVCYEATWDTFVINGLDVKTEATKWSGIKCHCCCSFIIMQTMSASDTVSVSVTSLQV